MGIEYLGLSSINGPLVILEGVQDAFFDEIVEFTVDGKTKKIGRIIELYEDKAVIQVFEGTENMSLDNTRTKLTGHPMEVSLAPDMLGRTFNGIGKPIDGLGPLITDVKRDVNGLPLNPVRRKYPRNYIRTGISAIDGLTTLIRGQKLPIFSGNGLPHDQLAAQLLRFGNHVLRDIQRHQDPLHLLGGVPFQVAHIVPAKCQFFRGQPEKRLFNCLNSWHDATPLLPAAGR